MKSALRRNSRGSARRGLSFTEPKLQLRLDHDLRQNQERLCSLIAGDAFDNDLLRCELGAVTFRGDALPVTVLLRE